MKRGLPMEPEWERQRWLAEAHAIAARRSADAAVKLGGSGISHENFSRLCKVARDAQARSVAALAALEEHVALHRCDARSASVQRAGACSERLKVFPKSWAATQSSGGGSSPEPGR